MKRKLAAIALAAASAGIVAAAVPATAQAVHAPSNSVVVQDHDTSDPDWVYRGLYGTRAACVEAGRDQISAGLWSNYSCHYTVTDSRGWWALYTKYYS